MWTGMLEKKVCQTQNGASKKVTKSRVVPFSCRPDEKVTECLSYEN